ncbi:MAG TPA: cellulase family glycosylhydrolase [Thermoleophilaceae bacterium]
MRSRRSTQSRALLALLALLVLAPSAAAAPQPPFDQHGRWMLDAKGRVVVLHGVNMVNKRPPYAPDALGFGADDVKAIKREGFNTVRLGIIYKGLEAERGRYDDGYLARIVATARLLQKHGIYPLVDFHQDMYNERFNGQGFPDWAVRDDGLPAQPDQGFPANYLIMPALQRAFDYFFDDVDLQEPYAAAWAHVAQRFRKERGLVGFDIFNEPFPGTRWQSCANPAGCPDLDAKLAAFSKRTFEAIRRVDRRNVLWWEPYLVFNNGAQTSHGDTGDGRAGMSFHMYCLGETPGLAPPGGPPDTGGCGVEDELVLDNARSVSDATGDALLLSEFGASDDLASIGRVVEEADAEEMSWQYWSWWNRDVCCERPTEGVIRDISKPPTPDNLKQDKLDVLVRPYPQAVAGTPERWSFDRATREFALEYRVKGPDGRRRPTYVPTEVFVPRRHYPKGYTVEVSGARVVSKKNAELLLLRAKLAAGKVSVRVRPRG